jgi:predicted esterase
MNTDLESRAKALQDLESLVDEEGPFDGVMAFSQGAALAASLIVHKLRKDPTGQRRRPVFRCAIFFSGGVPGELSCIHSTGAASERLLSFDSDGEIIQIPTAHIWGATDQLYPTFGPVLSKLCRSDRRFVYIHPGGHEIPGPKDPQQVQETIVVIEKTIEGANLLP